MSATAHHHASAHASERLVVDGFRAWMAGYDSGDIGCWEDAWNAIAAAVGAERAKPVVTALANCVLTLRSGAARPLSCFEVACPAFCRDECAVLALVAACQHGESRQARAAAYALTGVAGAVDDAVAAAEAFAARLADSGLSLALSAECRACCLAMVASPASRLN